MIIIRFAWLSLVLCVMAGAAAADDAKPQLTAKDAPSRLRCIFKMNVILIKNFDVIAKAAGIGYQNLGYGVDLDKPLTRDRKVLEDTPRTLMEKGEVDVCLTVDISWAALPALDKWAPAGLAHNPNFRLYQQARFLPEKPEERDNSKIAEVQAALDKVRKTLEVRVDAINKDLGKQVVFIVPVGDAIVKLREMVVDGKFPGVTKQSELFLSGSRGSIHVEKHANLLTAYCNYAAIYQKSPVGLKLEMKEDITDEQHAILQKLAWETVSQYPHAGLKK